MKKQMHQIKHKSEGAAIILYLLIMAVFISILMATTYSRLLLSVKRSASSADTLITNYAAESEVNDLLARLSGNYIKPPLKINEVKQLGTTKLTITGTQNGDIQTITVTADRAFASSKLVAERTVSTTKSVEKVDLILSLDCTGSMASSAIKTGGQVPPDPSRFDALKAATLNFLNSLNSLPDRDSFRVGISVFGVDAKWLTIGGQEVRPDVDMPLSKVEAAVRQGIGYQNGAEIPLGITRATSPACQTVRDATSVGTGFAFSNDYFATHKTANTKQVEVVITDGEPNSRIVYPACAPSVECTHTCRAAAIDFLGCTIADTNTGLPAYDTFGLGARKGTRDPNVDAYAVTILSNPPADVTALITKYLGDKYYNATQAVQLGNILSGILNSIVSSRESYTIKKVIPGT